MPAAMRKAMALAGSSPVTSRCRSPPPCHPRRAAAAHRRRRPAAAGAQARGGAGAAHRRSHVPVPAPVPGDGRPGARVQLVVADRRRRPTASRWSARTVSTRTSSSRSAPTAIPRWRGWRAASWCAPCSARPPPTDAAFGFGRVQEKDAGIFDLRSVIGDLIDRSPSGDLSIDREIGESRSDPQFITSQDRQMRGTLLALSACSWLYTACYAAERHPFVGICFGARHERRCTDALRLVRSTTMIFVRDFTRLHGTCSSIRRLALDVRTFPSVHVGDALGTGLHGRAPWILTGRVAGAIRRVPLGRRLGSGAAARTAHAAAERGSPPPARSGRSRRSRRPATVASPERRIRNDGSPYGVERRAGPSIAHRRAPEHARSMRPHTAATDGIRCPTAAARPGDYAPYLPDLLKRLHGR